MGALAESILVEMVMMEIATPQVMVALVVGLALALAVALVVVVMVTAKTAHLITAAQAVKTPLRMLALVALAEVPSVLLVAKVDIPQ